MNSFIQHPKTKIKLYYLQIMIIKLSLKKKFIIIIFEDVKQSWDSAAIKKSLKTSHKTSIEKVSIRFEILKEIDQTLPKTSY